MSKAERTDDKVKKVERIDFRPRKKAGEGYSAVLTPANAPLKDLEVGRLRLDAKKGGYQAKTGEREVLLHVLVGQCTVEAEGQWGRRTLNNLGERRDVFSGLPTSVLLGPRTKYSVASTSRTVDLAVAGLPSVEGGLESPLVVRPQDVRVHEIGESHYYRVVREVLGDEGFSSRIRVGETVNPVGLWSSWPHHDFEADPELAPQFEEVFLYFTKPRYGWGLQRRQGLYYDLQEVDDVIVVRNGDAAVIPLGDHPLVAGVDSEVMYVWLYVSPIAKTYAKWAEDIGGYA
jgi:5-deoxy-D-glucuronate isomerase